jgi:hypothetical protein
MTVRDPRIPHLDLGRRAFARIDELATISDADGRLERLFLSAAHRRAANVAARMMIEAGCDSVQMDALGNIVGRYEGTGPGRPAVLIGSHLDSVRDAGKFDGPLGVVAGIGVESACPSRSKCSPSVTKRMSAFRRISPPRARWRGHSILLGSRCVTVRERGWQMRCWPSGAIRPACQV